MAVQVYRCARCGREVLVRIPGPLSEQEVARRVAEEFRPSTPGPRAARVLADRLREDIWGAISATREFVPREEVPEACPACRAPSLVATRRLE